VAASLCRLSAEDRSTVPLGTAKQWTLQLLAFDGYRYCRLDTPGFFRYIKRGWLYIPKEAEVSKRQYSWCSIIHRKLRV
jgi:hypothetical protein